MCGIAMQPGAETVTETTGLLPPPAAEFSYEPPPASAEMYLPVPDAKPQPPAWWACAGMSLSFEMLYLIVFIIIAIVALLCRCLLVECVLLGLAFLALIIGLRTSCLLILAFVAIFTYNNWQSLSDFARNIS
jgi:hypothetical protein